MNPALVPLATVRVMSDAEFLKYAKLHKEMNLLETELFKRLEKRVQDEERASRIRLAFLRSPGVDKDKRVQGIVDWAKQQGELV